MKRLSLILMAVLMSVSVALADQYCFFGYGTTTQTGVLSDNTEAKCAIYIPAEVASRYKGCYINKVRVGLASRATSLKVFVTKDLNGAYDVTGTSDAAYTGTTDVQTSSKFEITGEEGFYVGYEVKGSAPIVPVSNVYNDNGCWADLGDGWKNYATDNNSKSPALCLDVRISGAKMPVDANLICANGTLAAVGEPANISATVKNQGYSKITKLGLAYSIDGGEEKTVESGKISILTGKDAEVVFSVPETSLAIGVHDVKMRITTVNGTDDEVAENNSGESQINVLQFVPGKRLFVEEQTGIDCGFCPRGIVGFQHMSEKYPSQFVGVAVHCYDGNGPLAPTDYADFVKNLITGGFPGSTVMRQNSTQPSADNLEAILKNLNKITPQMHIDVESKLSTDGKSVDVTAMVTPLIKKAGARYKLGFILTEDNVTGYSQANNFAGGSYGEMGGWENKSGYVSDPLQHVARATFGYEGIEGSIPSEFNLNEVINYNVSIPVPSSVQNKSNLNAIAILIDSVTGYVENAAEAHVGANSADCIESTENATAPVVRIQNGNLVVDGYNGNVKVYTLDGTQVAPTSLTHGIYVVKGEGARQFVKRIAY